MGKWVGGRMGWGRACWQAGSWAGKTIFFLRIWLTIKIVIYIHYGWFIRKGPLYVRGDRDSDDLVHT